MIDYNQTTINIKYTLSELDKLINALEFLTTLNLPIDKNYIKPYSLLKDNLLKIQKEANEKCLEHQNDKKK